MTTLSQYMAAERFDTTEPASFYLPGVPDEWGHIVVCKRVHLRRVADEELPEETEDEVEL